MRAVIVLAGAASLGAVGLWGGIALGHLSHAGAMGPGGMDRAGTLAALLDPAQICRTLPFWPDPER